MRRRLSGVALVVLVITGLITAGCGGRKGVWFRGDFTAALRAARERSTLVMIDFYTSWCTYCRRMKKESYSLPAVQQELGTLVALRLNAERRGADLARRYSVSSYPTIVFIDADGAEVDRIHYLPPADLVEALQRIRSGDTFAACYARNTEDPIDLAALQRTVLGLLDRLDPDRALARIEAFHAAGGEDPCPLLFFKARAAIHSRTYQQAGELYRDDWPGPLELAEHQAPALANLLPQLDGMDRRDQARRLREVRRADAGRILGLLQDTRQATPEELLDSATFAHDNGHYEMAAALYVQWYRLGRRSGELEPEAVAAAARNLYLAGTALETAVEMARAVRAIERSASASDTLARLLYVTGAVDEAMTVQAEALHRVEQETAEAGIAEDAVSKEYQQILEKMQAGVPLDDQPPFEHFPS